MSIGHIFCWKRQSKFHSLTLEIKDLIKSKTMPPKFKKQKLSSPPEPSQWSCVETILGPSCVDADLPSLARIEAKLARYDTKAECQETECFRNPQMYNFENKNVLGVLSSFLDFKTLSGLADLDPLTAELVDDDLKIAQLSEMLSNGFFSSLASTQLFAEIIQFWEMLRQVTTRPRNYIEQEAGHRALDTIVRTISLDPYIFSGKSALLHLVRQDGEFVNFVLALFPGAADEFVWFLTGGRPEGIVALQDKLDFSLAGSWWPDPSFVSNAEAFYALVEEAASQNDQTGKLTYPLVLFIGQELDKLLLLPSKDNIIPNVADDMYRLAASALNNRSDDQVLGAISGILSNSELPYFVLPSYREDMILELLTNGVLSQTAHVSMAVDVLLAGMVLLLNLEHEGIRDISTAIEESGLGLPGTMNVIAVQIDRQPDEEEEESDNDNDDSGEDDEDE